MPFPNCQNLGEYTTIARYKGIFTWLVIFANLSGVMLPSIILARKPGLALSFRLTNKERILFLYSFDPLPAFL